MNAGLILVGTELLNGMMVDTNSIYMASLLNEVGINIKYKLIVGDEKSDLIDSLNYLSEKVDLIILSGGLGPTIDDITKETIAAYLNINLVEDKYHLEQMINIFNKRNIPVFEKNRLEIMVPESSIIFRNDVGIAPAFYIDKIAAFPGVPVELKNQFPKFIDFIKNKFNLNNGILIKDIVISGIAESVLEEMINPYIDNNLTIEFLVKDYGIIIRIIDKIDNKEKVLKVFNNIKNLLLDNIIGYNDFNPQEELVSLLKDKKLKLSVAESCTGGKISDIFVSMSGVSEIFIEGIVTYANSSKMNRLNVKEQTLINHGAVSEEVVKEMLKGLSTDCGIAVSGVAGPGGGTLEKPVGTVVIGVKYKDKYLVKRELIGGSRENIRVKSAFIGINRLLKMLKEGTE